MSKEKYAEYKEKLKRIEELKKQIANPENDLLHRDHLKREEELRELSSEPKVKILMLISSIVNHNKKASEHEKWDLYEREDNGQIVMHHRGDFSEANHPKFYYFESNGELPVFSITTSNMVSCKELTAEDVLDKFMSGQGFMR